jgi:hypothetical protein
MRAVMAFIEGAEPKNEIEAALGRSNNPGDGAFFWRIDLQHQARAKRSPLTTRAALRFDSRGSQKLGQS